MLTKQNSKICLRHTADSREIGLMLIKRREASRTRWLVPRVCVGNYASWWLMPRMRVLYRTCADSADSWLTVAYADKSK